MSKPFAGQRVLVTGANSGIGEAVALAYAEAGARVSGVVRREDALAASRKRHPQIHWVLADVAKRSAIQGAVESVVRDGGGLDILVNNAAIFEFGPLAQSNEEMIRNQYQVNVFGLIFTSQSALPALQASRGTLLNISSAAGHKAAAGGSVYASTKAAVESLTRSWALELAPTGVRVNAIAPGPTETPGFEKTGVTPEAVAAMKAAFTAQVPLARMASTAEIARWVLAVTDPAVTWVTGQVLSVDGGMSLT